MSGGPLRQVMTALEHGTSTFDEMARRTGLSQDMVEVALEQLVRMGRVKSEFLTGGCPPVGCGGCPAAGPDAGTCGSGPVLVGLSPVRRAR